jgi:MtrB/PioB family decaheme-associated outer membrane protein
VEDIVRIRTVIATLALAALPIAASAQGTSQPFGNWVDFGVRGTDISGDSARFERYRDLGDGLFMEAVRLNRETSNGWLLDVGGDHVGRLDQRYTGRFARPGTFKGVVQWDQIPMLMSNSSLTVFSGVGSGVLTVDDANQGEYGSNESLFLATARDFDIKSRRHAFMTDLEYVATPEWTFSARGKYTDREGVIPYGGSFGHSVLSETAAPVNHTLKDLAADAEFARDPVLVRVGYTASLFTNQNTTLTWDNPFNLTDTTSSSSRGRGSLPPSNTYYGVNSLVSVKLPHRSRVSAYASVGSLTDAGDPIMPFTINSAVAVDPLTRMTVDGEARTTAVNLNFTSRPTRLVNVALRFRSYDYDNRTPLFAVRQFESYDGSPTAVASQVCGVGDAICTEPFGVKRQNFDADLNLTPISAASIGVGYTRLDEDRSHRIFEATREDIARLSFDSVGTGLFTVRTKYEHSQRRATGNAAGIEEHLAEVLGLAGEQPNMRHYDVAERDRDRVTLLGGVMASANVSVNASVAAGKDNYIRDEFIPDLESRFGLRDNTHRVLTLGFDAAPAERATVAASYSYERYKAFSTSRQASPGPEFVDPSRDWSTDATDRVHSLLFLVDLTKLNDRVDVQVSYDFNRARALYVYGTGPVADRTLPEEVVAPSLATPEALPPTLSQLHRAVTDLTYWVTDHLGVGGSYWFEDFNVEDFTLDVESTPNLVRGNTMLLGYLYRPYTTNTVWGRMVYRW